MSSSNSRDSVHDLAENFGYASYFNHLLKTRRAVDVTFILEAEDVEVEFSAHQLVLAMRSAYFADTFYGNQKEKENEIISFENVNPKAFGDMIRYCYDYKPSLETLEEICTLFRVAYEFKVVSLMNLCRTHLMDIEIMPSNVFRLLEVSECMEDKKFRYRCYNFLQEKTKDVMESYNTAQVTPAMVHIILDLPKLSLNSEIELIKWIFYWANAKVVEVDTACSNAREYLQNFLQNMNFLALTFEEFAKLCKDYPDVFTSEEVASICLNIAHPGAREMPRWYGMEVKIREYVGLRAKSIDKEIVEAEKCLVDIFALEVMLKCSMKAVKCIEKNLKKKESDKFEMFLNGYILNRHFEQCYEICKKLARMLGKGNVLESLKISEKEGQKVSKYFDAVLVTLEKGGLKYFLENEIGLKRAFPDDEVFKDFKKYLASDEARVGQEMLENHKEYKRMKKSLEDVEKLELVRMLENLHELYESYNECENLNEFSKEMCSLVIEKIKRLFEDYFGFLTEFEELIKRISSGQDN